MASKTRAIDFGVHRGFHALNVSGGGMNCVSCDKCVYHLGLYVFFPAVFLSPRVTGGCPVTTDLIMRVNARTTTATTTTMFLRYSLNKYLVRVDGWGGRADVVPTLGVRNTKSQDRRQWHNDSRLLYV